MKTSFTIQASFGLQRREQVTIAVGKRYRIEQMNKQAKKNRGRTGVIESIDDDFMPQFVMMKFDDTGRVAKVDPGDLVPTE